MRAGALRHQITIQSATETQNAFGEPAKTWATFATVWAAIEPISGREFYQNRQIGGEISHRVEMRYLSGVTPKMRILYGSRYFDIESVINEKERNVKHILMCKELV